MRVDKGKTEAALLALGLSSKRARNISSHLSKMELVVDDKKSKKSFTKKDIDETIKED